MKISLEISLLLLLVILVYSCQPAQDFSLEYVSGNHQSGIVTEALPNPIRVRVVNQDGLGIEDEMVTFMITSGGGSIDVNTAQTDANGYAQAIWTLGGSGLQTVEVSADVMQGSPLTFTATGVNAFVDPRDGETYQLLTIGGQTWFAENLRYDTAGSYFNPDNLLPEYGRLYNWATSTTVCPSGWHLPTDTEWTALEMSLGLSETDTTIVGYRGTHGTSMKSAVGWSSNVVGANSSGFNAFPAGHRSVDYYELGINAYFWTATEVMPNAANEALGRKLWNNHEGVSRFTINKAYYYSCRCVQD